LRAARQTNHCRRQSGKGASRASEARIVAAGSKAGNASG
jgi:hypothetical protein